jgi:hypothetical protein
LQELIVYFPLLRQGQHRKRIQTSCYCFMCVRCPKPNETVLSKPSSKLLLCSAISSSQSFLFLQFFVLNVCYFHANCDFYSEVAGVQILLGTKMFVYGFYVVQFYLLRHCDQVLYHSSVPLACKKEERPITAPFGRDKVEPSLNQ